jgi:deferrochelatase/peroxidase EfeB
MIGTENDNLPAPPDDTGEAKGLPASNLTVTFGFGPGIFDRPGLGLAAQRPAGLKPLPPVPGDQLNGLESGGDICVQACANDPQVVFHAVRDLARIGRGTVTMRWSQLGFGRTSTTSRSQETPRNLFGMKDGTANIKAEDTAAMNEFVRVDDGPPGCAAAASWSPAASGRSSRSGTAPRWKTRSRRSADASTAARRSASRTSSTRCRWTRSVPMANR